MKVQQILRELLVERVKRALRVDKDKFLLEAKKLGVPENTVYDFVNYQRSYVKHDNAKKLYFATKATIG